MAARGGFAASVRSARDAVVGNSSLRSYVWILGLAALVTAVGLAVDGRPLPAAVLLLAAGALLWLGGGFALPRTPEAHQRRVAFIYRGWAGGSQRAYDEFARRRERRAREAERLVLSPGLEEQRQRILDALEAGEEAGRDRRPPLPDRARHAAAMMRSIAEAAEDQDGEAIAELRSRVQGDYAIAEQAVQATTEKAIARLAKLRPPEGADGAHRALMGAFDDYLAALRAVHAGDPEPSRLEEAAERLRERARECIRPGEAPHAASSARY